MARYVGAGGMMVEFPVEVVQGTVLRVVLPTPRGPLEVEGEIVWTSPHGRVIRHGLAFPEPRDLDFLERVAGEQQSTGAGPAAEEGPGGGSGCRGTRGA